MDDEWIYGSRLEQIHQTLVEGRPNGMPAWGGKVPDEQLCNWRCTSDPCRFRRRWLRNRETRRPSPRRRCLPRRTKTRVGRRRRQRPTIIRARRKGRIESIGAVLITLAAAGASAAGLASAAGPAHDAGAAGVEGAASGAQRLTVCADPNNLPFSNRKLEGFENKIIALIARDLGERIDYVWWAQRRGYVRSTLNESKCDICRGSPPAWGWCNPPGRISIDVRVRQPRRRAARQVDLGRSAAEDGIDRRADDRQ